VRKRSDEFKREMQAFNEELKLVEKHYKNEEKRRKAALQKLRTALKGDGRFNDEEISALIKAPRELWEKVFPPRSQ
jgi:hypothetical protein